MIAPNFEQQWMASDPPPETPVIKNMPPILAGITTDMDNHIWVELPESPTETPLELPPQERVESESEFTEDAIKERKLQDGVRREELLAELRESADTPPVPPIEDSGDHGRGDGPGPIGIPARPFDNFTPDKLRRCEACDGTGKRWLLLTCRRCGGLGAVTPNL